MRPDPKCVIDRSRTCGACIAPSPRECPYAYLLDADELAGVVAAARRSADPVTPPLPAGGVRSVSGPTCDDPPQTGS